MDQLEIEAENAQREFEDLVRTTCEKWVTTSALDPNMIQLCVQDFVRDLAQTADANAIFAALVDAAVREYNSGMAAQDANG